MDYKCILNSNLSQKSKEKEKNQVCLQLRPDNLFGFMYQSFVITVRPTFWDERAIARIMSREMTSWVPLSAKLVLGCCFYVGKYTQGLYH